MGERRNDDLTCLQSSPSSRRSDLEESKLLGERRNDDLTCLQSPPSSRRSDLEESKLLGDRRNDSQRAFFYRA